MNFVKILQVLTVQLLEVVKFPKMLRLILNLPLPNHFYFLLYGSITRC